MVVKFRVMSTLITRRTGNTSSQVQATLHKGQIRIGPKAKVGQLVSMTQNRVECTSLMALLYSDVLSYSIWLLTSNSTFVDEM